MTDGGSGTASESAGATVRRFLAARWTPRARALVLCTGVYFGARLGTAALAALEPRIVSDLGVTHGLFGLAITALSLVTALVQLPSGALGDRFGERAVIASAVVLTGGATASVALAPTYWVFLPAVVAVGAGSGLYYSPATSLLDRLFDRTGQAIGTFRIGGQVAGAVAPVLASMVAVHAGWRGAVFAAALALVPVAVGLVAFMPPSDPADPTATLRGRLSLTALIDLLARPGVAATTLVASLVQFVEVAAFTFLPVLLHGHHGLPLVAATTLYGAYFALVAALQPVTGRASDRYGRDWTTAVTLLAGLAGFGLLIHAGSLAASVVGVGLAAVSMTWATPVQARLVDGFDADERGTGFGLVRTVYLLVGALGGAVTGAVATRAGWSAAVALLVGVLALSLVVLTAAAVAPGGRSGE